MLYSHIGEPFVQGPVDVQEEVALAAVKDEGHPGVGQTVQVILKLISLLTNLLL
jgi:hypothetical protein